MGTLVDILIPEKLKSHLICRFLTGFSLISNTGILLNSNSKGKGKLECLDGIRFLSMSWVMLSHVLSLGETALPINNLLKVVNEVYSKDICKIKCLMTILASATVFVPSCLEWLHLC